MSPQDHPWSVNLALLVVVLIQAVPSAFGWIPNIWTGMINADPALSTSIYLGFVGAASIVAGFAGVVVVFGLSGSSPKFRQFRLVGGRALAQNWTSTIASGFTAAGLSLVSALLTIADVSALAPWFFELAILLLVHGSIRLIWLMRGLVGAVTADDVLKEREASVKPASEAPWRRKAS